MGIGHYLWFLIVGWFQLGVRRGRSVSGCSNADFCVAGGFDFQWPHLGEHGSWPDRRWGSCPCRARVGSVSQ